MGKRSFEFYVVHLHIFGLWDGNQTFKISEANIENYFWAVLPWLFCVKQTKSAFIVKACYVKVRQHGVKEKKKKTQKKKQHGVAGSGL